MYLGSMCIYSTSCAYSRSCSSSFPAPATDIFNVSWILEDTFVYMSNSRLNTLPTQAKRIPNTRLRRTQNMFDVEQFFESMEVYPEETVVRDDSVISTDIISVLSALKGCENHFESGLSIIECLKCYS